MSVYAHIYQNQIVEFKEISDVLYQSWVDSNNTKKNSYFIVNYTEKPTVSSSETTEQSFVINENSVDQVWTTRAKSADELRKSWTAYEFLNRFTFAERTTYRTLAQTDDFVADIMGFAHAAQEVVSDDPMTHAGMDYLVFVGLISQQRKDEIMDTNT